MSSAKRSATYRPLVSGIKIINAVTQRPGTLGCIGVDANGAQWLISCAHVLGRVRGAADQPKEDEEIWQSTADRGGGPIATTQLDMMDPNWDYGAARIRAGIAVTTQVLEMHDFRGTAVAEIGMRVLKSGAETGVTEGIVTDVSDALITIETGLGMPEGYVLCDHGDSGAIWVDAATSNAVGLHIAGADGHTARARPFAEVLRRLRLALLMSS